jgi:hypothetical protein
MLRFREKETPFPISAEKQLMSEPTTTTPDQVFYRYETPDGRVLLVDDLDKLPADVRPKAKRILFEGNDNTALHDTLAELITGDEGAASSPVAGQSPVTLTSLHVPSFALGVGTGLGVFFILRWLFSSSSTSFGKRVVVSLALTAGMVAVLSAFYLGWLRRSTGQTDGLMATPTELIDDAKRTMQLVEERRKEQQKQLDELDRAAK